MNTKKQILLASLLLALVLSSCSIQKRIYTSGYHVEWKHKGTQPQNEPIASIKPELKIQEVEKNKEIVLTRSFEQDQVKNDLVAGTTSGSINHAGKKPLLTNRINNPNRSSQPVSHKQIAPVHKKEVKENKRGVIHFMFKMVILLVLLIVLIVLLVMFL